MSFQKFKRYSYCVGGRHRSATKIFFDDITSKGSKVLTGCSLFCNRKKSMTVNGITKKAEGFGDFSENLCKKRPNASKKMAKNVLSNPWGALDLTAKIATAAVPKNSKQILSTCLFLITIYNTGRGLYLGKFV